MTLKNLLRAVAFLLALTLSPLAVTAGAHDHGKRKRVRRHVGTTLHSNQRNLTSGVPRRVRRGRNPTPGMPRGSFAGTPSTFPHDEGQRLGQIVRREDRGNVRARGRIAGNNGRGRVHGKH